MQEQFPPVLVPENCESSFGLPQVTNSSECIICGTDLSDFSKSVITHPDCRASFCASCLLQWHRSCRNATCPTCRGNLGANLKAPGYDPANKEIYLVSKGTTELRRAVGDEVFLRAPRIERLVRTCLVIHMCADIDPTNVHLAMANKPVLLDKLLSQAGRSSPIAPLERAAFVNARAILRDWVFSQGVTRVQEYRFLDGDGDVRYYVPILPKVRVFASKDDLVDYIRARERFVSRREMIGSGLWLKTVSSRKLRKLMHPKDDAGLAIVKTANDHSVLACSPNTRWALYAPGDTMDNAIFACPLKVFRVGYIVDWEAQGKPGLLRTFTTSFNTPRIPPEPPYLELKWTPARHRALHEYVDQFSALDEIGVSMFVLRENTDDAKEATSP